MIATTHQQVQHALALSDLGVLLLIGAVAAAVLLWALRRPGPGVVDGSMWEPEQPRVTIAARRPFDQDCPHALQARGRCLDCGADLVPNE